MQRYKSTKFNEIVFSLSTDYDELLYNFNGSAKAYTESGERLSCDVFMTYNNEEYLSNPLYFKGGLGEGMCAISENIAFEFGLRCGDSLKLGVGKDNKQFVFTIDEILPSQSGIDNKYMYEGVLILAENAEFIEAGKSIYTSFTKDGDDYNNLDNDASRNSVIFTEKIIEQSEKDLIKNAFAASVAVCIFIVACEVLVFSKIFKKYNDYSILISYGIRRARLFGIVFRDMSIKYLLPLILNFFVWYIQLRYYHTAYIVPALVFFAIGAVIAVTVTFIMERYKCRMRKRLFSK